MKKIFIFILLIALILCIIPVSAEVSIRPQYWFALTDFQPTPSTNIFDSVPNPITSEYINYVNANNLKIPKDQVFTLDSYRNGTLTPYAALNIRGYSDTGTYTYSKTIYEVSGQYSGCQYSVCSYNSDDLFLHLSGTTTKATFNFSPTADVPYIGLYDTTDGQQMIFNTSGVETVSITPSFTADPGFNVTRGSIATFNDTSTVSNGETISTRLWDFGDGKTQSNQNPTAEYYSTPGTYNVSLHVTSPSNSTGATVYHTLNVLDFVYASNVTLNLDVKAASTGALLAGSSIGIQNTTDNIWRNSTSATGLPYFTTTEPGGLYPLSVGQTVRLYAAMSGYKSQYWTVTIPYDGYHAYAYLVSNAEGVNATNAGSVVASVVDQSSGVPISGAGLVTDDGQMGVSNSAGSYIFYNMTAGAHTVTTTASNYQSSVTAFNVTPGAINGVLIQLVGVGMTPVPTYSAQNTTTVNPYVTDSNGSIITDANGNPIRTATSTSGGLNEQGTSGLMSMMGEIFQLWPLAVLGLILKMFKVL